MIRKVLGFVVLAIVVLIVLKIALALLGVVIGLSVSLLVFAAMGYGFYLVVRLVSPKTADRIQDMIRGRPAAAP